MDSPPSVSEYECGRVAYVRVQFTILEESFWHEGIWIGIKVRVARDCPYTGTIVEPVSPEVIVRWLELTIC